MSQDYHPSNNARTNVECMVQLKRQPEVRENMSKDARGRCALNEFLNLGCGDIQFPNIDKQWYLMGNGPCQVVVIAVPKQQQPCFERKRRRMCQHSSKRPTLINSHNHFLHWLEVRAHRSSRLTSADIWVGIGPLSLLLSRYLSKRNVCWEARKATH